MPITSVTFRNFKALRDYSVSLHPMNVLVGPNNSGKSTILSAFRVLEQALRTANPSLPTTNLSHFRISGLRRQKCPSGTTNAYEPGKSVGQTSVLRTPPGCGSTPSAS